MGKLHDKLRNNEIALGTHISLNDSLITELIGNVGFDYLWIDTEHSSIGLDCLQKHLIAARASGASAIVRVPCIDPIRVKPILEMGPDGIVFPQVNTYEQAKLAIASCMYPPKGIRGFGPRRAVQFGRISLQDYVSTIDDALLKILQIEHIDAVNDLENIVTIEGIGALVIGPCDLAASMGHLGDTEHPDVTSAIRKTIVTAKDAGIPIGVSIGVCSPEVLHFWIEQGMSMISLATDTDLLFLGASSVLRDLKNAAADIKRKPKAR